MHRNRKWEIIYYRSGNIDSVVGGNVHAGLPAVVLAIPPETPHAEIAHTAYSNFFIQIDAPHAQPWPAHCYDDEYGTIGHICGSLVREWTGNAPDKVEMLGLLIGQLDIVLRRMHEQAGISDGERLVREAERLLEERFTGPIMIADVAREIGISPSSLRSLFARLRDRTPTSYLQAKRVERALGIIRNSNISLETIAGGCGYDSASHLSRHVKRATGQSPGALRAPRG